VIVHLDYETRSRADLKTVGAYRYAADQSFEILMAGVSADDSDRVYLWVNPKYETPDMLSDPEALEILDEADLIYAHNAPFEIAATWGDHFFPLDNPLNLNKWRCTAAMARRAGMPPSLDKCAEALGLTQQKDKKGAALIRKFSIPNKDGTFNDPKDFPDEWLAFGEYCKQDVRTEKAIHQKLKAFELTGEPLETFLFDLRMNHAGIPVNRKALLNAQKIVTDVQSTVTKQFVELTQLQPTQREKVREIVGLADMTSDTVAGALQSPLLDADKRKILSLYQKLSYAAVKKIETMLDCVCPDGRVRGCHTYYGAGTGRWSGRLIQPQNFKKTPRWMKGLTDQIYADVIAGKDADYLDLMYGDPFELLSGIIRHFIHGDYEMLDGDYNAIEARIICWLAGEKEMLAMWATGRDLYRFMASSVYGIPEAAVDGDGRDHGKRIILGCGYGMGPVKFKATCEVYGVECSEELAESSVKAYRQTHPNVVKYWYFLDRSARSAIAEPGTQHGPFTVRSIAGIPYLLGRLPSGRSIAYPHPKIEKQPGDDRDQITYWGQLPVGVAWGRVKIYGGKFAENFSQGVAADIMSNGARVAEARGMMPFTLIHDQGLALRTKQQSPDEFSAALASLPDWARGLPLKVESKIAPYYRK
jgi:DNA polymerase